MKGTFCCFILTLQIASWVSATTRTFAPNHDFLARKQGLISDSLESKQGAVVETVNGKREVMDEANYGGVRKIGSSPPSCDHKCYGCVPCEAIQVPTTKRHSRVGAQFQLQYTNYEPEGWKCKCGPSFYSP